MPTWTLHGNGRIVEAGKVVLPEERLAWPLTIGIGAQHVIAMFGATFLVPVLTGFPPSTTLLFSGLGTLLFLLITRNRVPSYLGSSFAFIAPITASTQADSMGAALGGVMVTGLLLAALGAVIQKVGTGWISTLMPPVVMGSIVALIGLNLVPVTYNNNFSKAPFTAVITLIAIVLCTVLFKGILGRVSVLLGVVVGYVVALLRGEVDLSPVAEAAWVGLPEFHFPSLNIGLLPIFLPVIVVLFAENVGHVTSVGTMTNRNLDGEVGRALMADGVATAISGTFGGSPTTTYGENIGVMSATRVYSTAAYWVAGITAILLSLSPKVGAVINSIPVGVLGGVTFVLYGLIAIVGFRMWIEGRVDFAKPKNQMTAGLALVIAIADLHWSIGGFSFTGIALGTVAALVIYHGMSAIGGITGTEEKDAPLVGAGNPDRPRG